MLDTADLPTWLVVISWISLILGIVCAIIVALDIRQRPQGMKVMNFVWPICCLFGSVIWLAAYYAWGRAKPLPLASGTGGSDEAMSSMHMNGTNMDRKNMQSKDMQGMNMDGMGDMDTHSMPVAVFLGTSHCGAGCSLADILVEWALFLVPSLAVLGGWHWLFSDSLFAGWVIAYITALAIGIAFQYFAIAPMNPQRSKGDNIKAAARADVLSLSSWQIGMYGTIAVAQLALFPAWLGGQLAADNPVFWFMMQSAMLVGFCTAYPVNWFLIHVGIKEKM